MTPFAQQKAEPLYTVEEYLDLERKAEERHEYLDGVLYAMAGEGPTHADICANLGYELMRQLRDRYCRVRFKDTKVFSGSTLLAQLRKSRKGLFSYPDIVVVCEEPRYLDQHRDVLVNPQVLIEVLSDSTEAFDRGEKFIRYRRALPSLTDYILVWQAIPLIEHFVRQADGNWLARLIDGIESNLTIASLHCTLPLSEIYRLVDFPLEDTESREEEGQNN
jgi:Uma2 family endonuclease